MYSQLFQIIVKYLYPGKAIRRTMKELETIQWLPRSELENIQLKKLQRLVHYAYEHVPFYRKLYQKEDIHPQDIKSFKDFRALPFLTRENIQNHLQDMVSPDYRGHIFEDSTGGSTGNPMRFFVDRSTAWWAFAVNARCRRWYGIEPGDKRAWVYGFVKDYSSWSWKAKLAAKIKRYRYLNSGTMTESEMKVFAKMLIKWKPDMIRAYPSALAIFARYLKEEGITTIAPKLIESTGEKLVPSQRRLFEEVFKAPIANHYSSYEIYCMAYQCPQGSNHVMEDRYLELIARGKIVDPGQIGEVVITSLNQYAMPFIRYLNGDIGIFESKDCSCGRGLPVLSDIVGRDSDLLMNADGHIVHWTSIYDIMTSKKEVYQYQLYQPDLRHIELRLVCKQSIDPALLESIRNELQPRFGKLMHISVKLVDDIKPTTAGKRRFIISEVKPKFR